MLDVAITHQFKRDLKLLIKRSLPKVELDFVVELLAREETLPEQYCDHKLSGKYSGFRECHIRPDWLLIYKIEQQILTLVLTRTGTHSDLF
jgi:mRNA interferase YafQ